MVNELLSFQKGNAKLGKLIFTFSIVSGYTCPFAKDCLAKVDRITGKLTDGPDTQFRCFSASQEALFPAVRKSRWDNFEKIVNAIKNNTLVELILNSIPKKATIIRVHVAGDFFSQAYFNAWMEVAKRLPLVILKLIMMIPVLICRTSRFVCFCMVCNLKAVMLLRL